MQIDEELIRHIANSSKLNLTQQEIKKFAPQLKEVLDYFEKIKEFDSEGIEPSFHPIKVSDVLREDEEEPSLTQEDALRNAEQKDGYFKGPGAI